MIRSGQVEVATAGTAVQAGTDEKERLYWFRADQANTGNIAIGNDGDDDVTMSNGLVLATADSPICVRCRLSDLYVDAANDGDKLCWFAALI